MTAIFTPTPITTPPGCVRIYANGRTYVSGRSSLGPSYVVPDTFPTLAALTAAFRTSEVHCEGKAGTQYQHVLVYPDGRVTDAGDFRSAPSELCYSVQVALGSEEARAELLLNHLRRLAYSSEQIRRWPDAKLRAENEAAVLGALTDLAMRTPSDQVLGVEQLPGSPLFYTSVFEDTYSAQEVACVWFTSAGKLADEIRAAAEAGERYEYPEALRRFLR